MLGKAAHTQPIDNIKVAGPLLGRFTQAAVLNGRDKETVECRAAEHHARHQLDGHLDDSLKLSIGSKGCDLAASIERDPVEAIGIHSSPVGKAAERRGVHIYPT